MDAVNTTITTLLAHLGQHNLEVYIQREREKEREREREKEGREGDARARAHTHTHTHTRTHAHTHTQRRIPAQEAHGISNHALRTYPDRPDAEPSPKVPCLSPTLPETPGGAHITSLSPLSRSALARDLGREPFTSSRSGLSPLAVREEEEEEEGLYV